MGRQKDDYLKLMLDKWQPNMVATSKWLQSLGISRQLVHKYIKSGWLKPIGIGAFVRPNENVTWKNALWVIQKHLSLPVHLGGLTSLMVLGRSQYIRLKKERVFIFYDYDTHMPKWFKDYDWGDEVCFIKTNFLPAKVGVDSFGISFDMSFHERAILECLYLAPLKLSLVECYETLEGLMTLRPKIMQELLEKCNSIKVKRLFLFMAEKANLPVMQNLNLDKIDLGSGTRSLVKNGGFDSKYKLTLPKELLNHE